jgi:hypothetical protein
MGEPEIFCGGSVDRLAPGKAPAGKPDRTKREREQHMPYLTEFCLFVAAFLAAFTYGDDILRHLDLQRLRRVWYRWRRR